MATFAPAAPRGLADLPQLTEEQAQGNTGLGGYFILCFGLYKNNLQK